MVIKRFSLVFAIVIAFWGMMGYAFAQGGDTPRAVALPTPYPLYGSADFFFPPYPSENDRLGYGKSSPHDTTPLQPGWYVDWGATRNPAHPAGAEYARTIYFRLKNVGWCKAASSPAQVTANYTGTALIDNIRANPGALWIIGNEPDSYYNGSPLLPTLYADLYHYFYTTIKATDPTAKVAMGAIVQPSPMRMEYLDKMLTHYQDTYGEPLPTDLWTIHLYRFSEWPCGWGWGAAIPPGAPSNQTGWLLDFTPQSLLNVSAMETSLRDFRRWMHNRGYGDVPLLITEYGVLPPPSYNGFSNEVAAQFYNDSLTMLSTAADPTFGLQSDGGRLVQMYAWFSTYHDPPAGYTKYGGDLFCGTYNDRYDSRCDNSPDALTAIGAAFAAQSAARYTPYADLQPVPPTMVFSTTGVLTAAAYIQNRGNITAAGAQVQWTLMDATSGAPVAVAVESLPPVGRRYAGTPVLARHAWRVASPVSVTASTAYTVRVSLATADANPANDALAYRARWLPLTDLSVAGLTFSTGSTFFFQQPVTLRVTATVRNEGAQTSPPTTLRLTRQLPGGAPRAQDIGSLAVPPLAGYNTTRLVFTLPVTTGGTYRISALLPSFITTTELYTANNSLTATLLAARFVTYLPLVAKE